ncbi:MAG: hypothetical protein EOO74_03680 [Myxococcales bacterium]|nr:MAG: hypothetical protein EOO74_03680 [Myxococcales bacterium]
MPLLPPSTITAKEQWMLDTVASELDAGRPCLVFGWHIALLPRLVRLLEQHLGEKVALLRADKVPAAKRQDWINEQVLAPGRRVLVTNPKAVETGLNNLVRFATQVWMQSPACNPVTYRQAVGRSHRIGQKQATRILFPVYRGTSQAALHTLLTQKVAVSLAVDGLDASSALEAAGAGDGQEGAGLRHLDVGQALYRLLTGEVRA